jgi:4-hydroxybenzoate polyprenyltransferase
MKPKYTEYDVLQAINAVKNGKSERCASIEWGIPRSTLKHRIHNPNTHQEAASHLQRLPPVLEDRFTHWILTQETLGFSVTHAQVRLFGNRLCALQGDPLPLGKRWVQRFFKRNPVLNTKKQYSIDSIRVNNATSDVIRPWFQKLQIPAIKAILPENRWNMDEAGIMEGLGINGLVIGHANRRFVQRKQPGSRNWTSFIECISATGRKTTSLVIYKGKSVQQQWFPADISLFKDWQFTATENGWTNNATALEWLEKVFIPQTQPRDQQPRLLVLDGHGSHETTEFIWKCLEYNIFLLFLPAHTSHVLQPLDLSIFSPLKASYRKHLNLLASMTDSTPIGKRNFLICYYKARQESLTGMNIRAGWRATGLWPVSMAKPLMSRLLLENSNQELEIDASEDLQTIKEVEESSIIWSTPKAGKEFRLQLNTLTKTSHDNLPTRRLLFKKAVKAFDQKDFALGQAEMKIQQLEAKLDQLQPRKKRKVQTSPNSKFADIQAIQRAQIAAGDQEIVPIDSDSVGDSEATEDCIEVEAL